MGKRSPKNLKTRTLAMGFPVTLTNFGNCARFGNLAAHKSHKKRHLWRKVRGEHGPPISPSSPRSLKSTATSIDKINCSRYLVKCIYTLPY